MWLNEISDTNWKLTMDILNIGRFDAYEININCYEFFLAPRDATSQFNCGATHSNQFEAIIFLSPTPVDSSNLSGISIIEIKTDTQNSNRNSGNVKDKQRFHVIT